LRASDAAACRACLVPGATWIDSRTTPDEWDIRWLAAASAGDIHLVVFGKRFDKFVPAEPTPQRAPHGESLRRSPSIGKHRARCHPRGTAARPRLPALAGSCPAGRQQSGTDRPSTNVYRCRAKETAGDGEGSEGSTALRLARVGGKPDRPSDPSLCRHFRGGVD
jgi:hypothetical protein